MPGHELGIEQCEPAIFEPCHEIDERDLARVSLAREHALAEEGAAQMHAIEAARKLTVPPDLDSMGVAERE
jgi:hypothetical protein